MVSECPKDHNPSAKASYYYQKVILPDERAFLLSEARQYLRRVESGTITGDKVVIIQYGKSMIDCGEYTKVWNEWPSP
jgi:hypothetical protein